MLLKYLRKKTRAILIGTLILIIPAFIFLYGWSRLSTRERIPYIIAKVGRTSITWEEYQRELQKYVNLFGKSYSSELEKQIKTQVLDGLIEKYLLIAEANRKDIKVTDNEIALRIREIFKDEKGQFDIEKFRLISKQYPEEINALEKDLRIQIMIDKLNDEIISPVKVSEDEAYKYFLTSDAKAKIKYIAIKPQDFKNDIEVSEDELKDYYEKNRESFKDRPWRKVEYIYINEDQIDESEIRLYPEEIEEYYLQHLGEWKGENTDTEFLPLTEVNPVRNNSENSQDTALSFNQQVGSVEISNGVRDKIEKKLKEMKNEELLKDKAWEISDTLLNENDWSSFAQKEGLYYGITGYFAKEEPISIPEFNSEKTAVINQIAFSLPFEEVSEPLRIGKDYAIIRPLNEEPEYEEIANRIREIVTDEKAKDMAGKVAGEFISEFKKGRKVEDIAEKHSIQIKESEYFTRYGFILDMGYVPEVIQKAFSSSEEEWNQVNTSSGEIFIIQTVDIKEPSQKEFQEAKERITNLVLYQKKQQVFMEWLKELKEKNKDKIAILWDELLPSR